METLGSWVGSQELAWALAIGVVLFALIAIAVVVRLLARRATPVPTESARRGLDLQLSRSREGIMGRLREAFSSGGEIYENLEEVLITSDFGIETTEALVQRVRAKHADTGDKVRIALQQSVLEMLESVQRPINDSAKPTVIMVLGVNGVGKTTTIGKVAARLGAEGKKVVLGAGDTFRAAAIEQLEIWAERTGADLVKSRPEADPAAVCYDAIKAGQARGADYVICDTAGRLHTKSNLMEELKKVKRVMAKAVPDAPHEVWLVLDATTGQNALSQARQFNEAVPITGVVVTKLDGTAKGGILVGVTQALQVPVVYIGIGEQIEDLRPFDPLAFVQAVLGEQDENG